MSDNIKFHNANLLSFKTEDNINDTALSKLFSFFLQDSGLFFFSGIKQEIFDDKLLNYLKLISLNELKNDVNTSRVIIEIKPSNIIINRGLMSTIWSYYEYPALIFLQDGKYKEQLEDLFYKRVTYDELCKIIDYICILYKSFEENVLWIQKGDSMPSVTDWL